jgi:hypothetical protein
MSLNIFQLYFRQNVAACLGIPPGYIEGWSGIHLPLLLPEHCVGDCPACGEDKEIIGSYGEELWPCC